MDHCMHLPACLSLPLCAFVFAFALIALLEIWFTVSQPCKILKSDGGSNVVCVDSARCGLQKGGFYIPPLNKNTTEIYVEPIQLGNYAFLRRLFCPESILTTGFGRRTRHRINPINPDTMVKRKQDERDEKIQELYSGGRAKELVWIPTLMTRVYHPIYKQKKYCITFVLNVYYIQHNFFFV